MKNFILSALLLFSFISMSGQSQPDSIVIRRMLGPVFQQNGRNLTPSKLLKITQSNQEAYSEMKIANKNYIASMFFQLPGGFLIGYPLGTALAGGDANWTLAAIGVGLVAVSIPLISAYNKHAVKAVGIYNRGLRYSSLIKPDIDIRLTGNAIGMYINF